MGPAALAVDDSKPPLVTRASLSAVSFLGARGPFSGIPEDAAKQLLAIGLLIGEKPGACIVQQYQKGEHFFFLLQGRVKFEISLESAEQPINVGTADAPWTPIGWSAFRPPHRYGTSVTALAYVELLRFDVRELEALFLTDPNLGWHFFRAITRPAEGLLFEARERLLGSLREGTSISNWGSAFDRARAITRRDRPTQRPSLGPPPATIPSQEAMVTNAAPDILGVLRRAAFFEQLPEVFLSVIAARARASYFCRGDVIMSQGDPAEDVHILSDGRVRLEYSGSQMRTAVLGLVSEPGTLLSTAAAGARDHYDITVRATRDGSVIVVSRRALEEALRQHPTWACLFQKRVLWHLSRDLRKTRAHLVSEEFDQEVVAIENVLEQVRTELRVSSPLHKIPHLLKAAVTLVDALSIIDRERDSTDRLSAHTAQICHELLAPIRRENRFFSGLKATYEAVVSAPAGESPADTRKRSAESFIRVFSEIPQEVSGMHHLPARSGNIFVFNHLKNHEHNTLPNGFQLTLDSHFISSMILHKKYGDPGVRVVRKSRANEYGHQDYYARQGHIPVYTPESDLPASDRSQRFREFVQAATEHISQGYNLVLAPEGTSYSTEMSPGPFRAGAFRLAATITPEPLVVPIAMAHFDRRLAHTKLVAVIKRPFRVSDVLKSPDDPEEMEAFLRDFRAQFATWVREAAALGRGT